MTIYYIFRDRIPFYLSIIWLYRWKLRKIKLADTPLTDLIGAYMITLTCITLGLVFVTLNAGESLINLVGFRWSFPSPITWGILTLAGTYNLVKKRGGGVFTTFEAYYLSFMTALAGGWLYEILRGIPYWILSGYAPWNWYKFNPTKVFLFGFQIFAFPIVMHLLIKKWNYKMSREMLILIGSVVVFYLLGFKIAPFYHQLGSYAGNSFYSWIMRLPMALLLYTILDEVRK